MADVNQPRDDERPEIPLLLSYRDQAHQSFPQPPANSIAIRARRRRQQRVALASVAAAVAVLLAGSIVYSGFRYWPDRDIIDRPTPPSPSATAAPSPSPSPSITSPSPSITSTSPSATADSSGRTGTAPPPPVDLTEVDWDNLTMTIRMPAQRDDPDCPIGPTTVTEGGWPATDDHGPGWISPGYGDGQPVFGDLTGDGRPEAVVWVTCHLAGGDSGDSSGQLLVVTAEGRQLVGLGYVGPVAAVIDAIQINGDRLLLTTTQRYTEVQQRRTYRWNGTRFVQVDGPTAFPP